MQLRGTVTKVELEGGFWGIKGEDGNDYRPVNELPPAFRKEGLKVIFEFRPAVGFSMFMWGTDVNISSIHQL